MAFEELMEHPPELEPVALARDDLAAIVYTSGTTGRPKGAMLSHFNYVWDAMAAVDVMPVQPGQDRLGLILPLFHVNAQLTTLFQVYVGGAVAMWERFSPSEFWETVQHYRPTTFSSVPTMLSILLAAPRPEGFDTSSLPLCHLRRRSSAPGHLLSGSRNLRPAYPRGLRPHRGHVCLVPSTRTGASARWGQSVSPCGASP